jgi:hypothetical protein
MNPASYWLRYEIFRQDSWSASFIASYYDDIFWCMWRTEREHGCSNP